MQLRSGGVQGGELVVERAGLLRDVCSRGDQHAAIVPQAGRARDRRSPQAAANGETGYAPAKGMARESAHANGKVCFIRYD
ncbi:hypothetical protein GCM10010151_06910 [Actinoallomurus spadix]|uniref:Uncharacterized protein n=1 Tax=Actinoallomurus spadix TaxID=79912 RepID=A0ABP3FNJ6_9ACTN